MRTLYLPSPTRVSPATERRLRQTIQDTVRIDPQSRTHGLVNLLITERERMLSLIQRSDVRPWRADVRVPGAVEPSERSLPEAASVDDFLYGVPDRWEREEVRLYAFDPSSTPDPVTGAPVLPHEFDAVVETDLGLVLQKGTALWLLPEGREQAEPFPASAFGVYPDRLEAFCLVSLAEDLVDLFPAYGESEAEVDFELDFLTIRMKEAGRYRIEVRYASTVDVTATGVPDEDSYLIFSATLPDFQQVGRVLDAAGNPVSYALEEGGVIRVFGTGTLFYSARRTIHHEPLAGDTSAEVSLSDVASRMTTLVRREDIHVYQAAANLCTVPPYDLAVSKEGLIGGTVLPHAARHVLPSEYHAVVAGDSAISLVEVPSGELLLTQEFASRRIAGVTWTREGHLGFVEADGYVFRVHTLKDVRLRQYGGLVAA